MALRVTAIRTLGKYPWNITELKIKFDYYREEWYSREAMYKAVKEGNKYEVNIFPFPKIIALISRNGTRYVSSEWNKRESDNLMKLPRG